VSSHFTTRPGRAAGLALGLLLIGGAAAARADVTESYWIPQNGDFEDPASWDGPVPDETVTAIFDVDHGLDLGPFVDFHDNQISHRAVIRAGNPFFLLWESAGVSYSYELMCPTTGAPSLVVAENPGIDVTLTILSGFLDTQATVIGRMAGSIGTIELGTFSEYSAGLSCASHLHVGDGGQGLLVMDQNVTVTTGSCVLGVQPGSAGEIALSDPTMTLTVIEILEVGAGGQGILSIGGNASVTSGSAVVAAASAAIGGVALDGANSSWTIAGPMSVGQGGLGTVTVSGDADLTSGGAIIGQQLDATGDLTVTGFGSSWTVNGPLDVGYFGNGNLTICDGGAVFVYGDFVTLGTWTDVFGETGGVGNVTVCGPASLWYVDGDLYVGFLWQGTLEVTDGGTVAAGSISVSGSSELAGAGTIHGPTTCSGTVRVGDPVGTLVVDGSFSSYGEMLIDLVGPGTFDVLSVTGSAGVGGALTVTLLDGYVPQSGDSFEIINAGSLSGAFDPVTLPELPPPLGWDVMYDYDADTVTLHVPLLGDLDGDGSVGVLDLLLLLGAWGPCPEPCPPFCAADLDADCAVGVTDILVLLASWG
jgi:T5SS/PEP-CTERM-associated repeat protein